MIQLNAILNKALPLYYCISDCLSGTFILRGKMKHTFLQMLKSEQYYLTGNVIDTYRVHSSFVDVGFEPGSERGYNKYLRKQNKFTAEEWNTILGFNASAALVSEIQLMIESKMRILNNTDSMFSVGYQVRIPDDNYTITNADKHV